uniref:Uncharacterized protein n=1 Tax=Romanomermis culicivorax TaxID=13658 RepID=A0A915L2Z5_ROMCU
MPSINENKRPLSSNHALVPLTKKLRTDVAVSLQFKSVFSSVHSRLFIHLRDLGMELAPKVSDLRAILDPKNVDLCMFKWKTLYCRKMITLSMRAEKAKIIDKICISKIDLDGTTSTENAKSVESKENGENENEEDIMDVGRMLHKQRLEKEYEILNVSYRLFLEEFVDTITLVKQWQDYSKRNEQKIKKDGTLTMRDLTQSQQLQTAMMEQQKTIERLLLAPKSEPIPTFPTTPEPPKPSIDTDSLVYKAGPTPYRSVYSSNGNIEKMEDSGIGDLSPNRPFFELSSSRKSSINPTASLVGDPNSVEIQIPVRRTSRSFYNEFSRGQSPMTLNDQRRRDSSSCDYKSTVGAATAPTTTLPPGDVWDYGANGRLGKNEILKPSQLFAYSAKKHEND